MSDPFDWIQEPIQALHAEAAEAARARQDQLTKPQGSLGRLEALAIRLAGMQGGVRPSVDPVRVVQFISDHGVVAEGVSAFPQSVTIEMLRNIARGGAAVSVMAASLGAEMEIINLGTASDPGPVEGVRDAQLGPGTGNIAREPAMSEAQLVRALAIGREALDRALEEGARLVIGGELGIGNTTPASALACALLGQSAEAVVGPGTGLDHSGLDRKRAAVEAALRLHATPGCAPLELLRCLGAFDLAALTGLYVRAAQRGVPMVIDGFIVSAAALLAVRLQPRARDWMLFSHSSAEPGHRLMLEALAADPLLDLGLRLGEATGALAALPLLRLACAIHNDMATFAEAGVSEAL
ncbi:MAG: nicotinate-nucleotide--dimethylbenzimidazole phosphoribosyltransferase [Chromatiaceae bacterium]|nr:nicotinate-nucleotide--dimethylbenzimidazole phosphoribosyltransferase [Chromatiaceae bacterium]